MFWVRASFYPRIVRLFHYDIFGFEFQIPCSSIRRRHRHVALVVGQPTHSRLFRLLRLWSIAWDFSSSPHEMEISDDRAVIVRLLRRSAFLKIFARRFQLIRFRSLYGNRALPLASRDVWAEWRSMEL